MEGGRSDPRARRTWRTPGRERQESHVTPPSGPGPSPNRSPLSASSGRFPAMPFVDDTEGRATIRTGALTDPGRPEEP